MTFFTDKRKQYSKHDLMKRTQTWAQKAGFHHLVVCLGVGPLCSVVSGKLSAQTSWWDDQKDLEGRVTL